MLKIFIGFDPDFAIFSCETNFQCCKWPNIEQIILTFGHAGARHLIDFAASNIFVFKFRLGRFPRFSFTVTSPVAQMIATNNRRNKIEKLKNWSAIRDLFFVF